MDEGIGKEMSMAVPELYEVFKLIVNSEFDEITITDQNGVFLDVIKKCDTYFGIPAHEMIGKSASELEQKGVFSKSVTLIVLKEKRKVSLVQDTASGKRLLVTGIPQFDENGNIIGVVNVSRDITEVEKLNQQLTEMENMLDWFREELRKKQAIKDNYIIFDSKKMERVIESINQIANTEVTVLLLGSTGVGKGFFAKYIHQLSSRRDKPFVQVNCGAIPESLMESELFGYEEGSFTGASKKGKKGLFEVVQNGTIFLDEIAEIPLHLQAKLLNVLQERNFYKIGGAKPIAVQARIISATNKDLLKLVNEGRFREDLFFRLNVVPIRIPSLKERTEDIPKLVHYFLDKFNRRYGRYKQISPDVYKILVSYAWPGNIRELENTLERLVITSRLPVIDKTDLLEINEFFFQNVVSGPDTVMPLKQALEQVEKQMLLKAMEQYKTTRKAAEALKIDQSTIVKKLKRIQAKDSL